MKSEPFHITTNLYNNAVFYYRNSLWVHMKIDTTRQIKAPFSVSSTIPGMTVYSFWLLKPDSYNWLIVFSFRFILYIFLYHWAMKDCEYHYSRLVSIFL